MSETSREPQFRALPAEYVDALREHVTEPLLQTPACDLTQRADNPGAILEELRRGG